MHRIVTARLARAITLHPKLVSVILLVLLGFSIWRVSHLHINHNQLDLIPQDLPSVVASKQMIDIRGGVGLLLIALKSNDTEHLKSVSVDLAEQIHQLPEVIRVTVKQDIEFIRERIALYIKTEDLEEGYKRIRKKIRSVIRKSNPFHITLTKKKEAPLDLDDIISKYRSLNKKDVDDNFYIDTKKEMVLMVVKPNGNAHDLPFVQKMINEIERTIAIYNQNNKHRAHLVEHYGEIPPDVTVSYGYTGAYKRNLDDSQTIEAALIPTSIVAFIGILLYLLFFLRRVSQVMLVMLTLVASVVVSFAFCEVVIGELNTVTAMLGAILMGIGIDYGIHFLYRLREEFTNELDLRLAITRTVEHSGAASLTSALTTTSALFVLGFAEFKGFGHFGIVTGAGVLLTAILMYTVLPVFYLTIDAIRPNFKDNLIVKKQKHSQENLKSKPYPYARTILFGAVLISAFLAFFAFHIGFDYDVRSMVSSDRPSIALQEEISDRFQISSDPVGIFTHTLEETKAVYEKLNAQGDNSTIDTVVSLFAVVPDGEQQKANRKILDKFQKYLERLNPDLLTDKERELFDKAQIYLAAQPFELKDVPEHIVKQFQPVAKSQYKGYVTYVYPKVSIWDSREITRFAREVGSVEAAGKTFYSAGMAILYADLARIVLRDGKQLTLIAALLVFGIVIFSFRSLRGALFAMLPLTAGVLWMLGLMTLTGWHINFMNIVVFPVVFGYGISSGIHLYHRYWESHSIYLAVRRTGAAVAASSITTLVGWAALLISQHRGLESMGILACFGIASALGVSLTILPSIVQVWENRKQKGNGEAPPSGA